MSSNTNNNTNTESTALNLTQTNIEATSRREQRFLHALSGFLCSVSALSLIGNTAALFSGPAPKLADFSHVVTSSGGVICYGLSWWLSRRLQTLRVASWIAVLYSNFAICLAVNAIGITNLGCYAFFLTALLLSIFLLPWPATLTLALFDAGYSFLLYFIQVGDKAAPGAFAGFAVSVTVVLLMTTAIGIQLSRHLAQLKKVNTLAIEQNEALTLTLAALQEQQTTGQAVSYEVNALAAQLRQTANQQSSGANEQRVVVGQLNLTVQEMGAALTRITDIARDVAAKTANNLSLANGVHLAATRAAAYTLSGNKAVQQAEAASSEVATLYEELTQVVTELSEKAKNTTGVAEALGAIATEIHLLSLNAGIEAAGNTVQGERFGVIAAEVRELANRSKQAAATARATTQQIESGMAKALTALAGGEQKAAQLLLTITTAARAIHELDAVTKQNQAKAAQISAEAAEVKQLTEMVEVQIGQQNLANQQLFAAFAQLDHTAEDNAAGSRLVAESAANLEELTTQLVAASNKAGGENMTSNQPPTSPATPAMPMPTQKKSAPRHRASTAAVAAEAGLGPTSFAAS